jgi:hypothetical protein
MRQTRSLSLLFAASLGAVLAMSAAACADTVGTAGAVNTTSSGTPPAGATRVIQIGTQVVENEKIETTGTGSVQVLFIDKTTLNVGPNSTLVIDRFVYNPATTRGELAISLGKGVLRVVGGVATHSEGATIRTPVAAIGLRGGIAIISHSGAKGTQAILGFGHMSVTTLCFGSATNCGQTTVEVTRPGYGVSVAGLNKAPSSPAQASSQELAQSNSQLGSHRGQSGGATQQPTDNLAQSYNVGTPTSPGAQILTATSSAGRANTPQTVLQATQRTVQQGAQVTASTTTAKNVILQSLLKPVTPPPPPPAKGAPTTTYAIVTPGPFSTTTGASPVPYLTGAFAGTGGFKVSPILGYQRGGFNPGSTTIPDTTSRQFQAGLSVTGQGAAQNATLFVMTSVISNAPNIGFTQAGGFDAVTMRNPAHWYGLADGAVSSATQSSASNTVPNTNGTPNGSYSLYNKQGNLTTGVIANNQSYNFVEPGGPANYNFNPISTGTPTLSANNHPNLTLHGYVGGIMATATGGTTPPFVNYTHPYIVTNVTGTPDDVGIYLPGNSSEMGAVFYVKGVNAPLGGLSTSSYVFGSYNPSDPNNTANLNTARGAYVNPSNFAARQANIFDSADTPVSTRNGTALSASGGYANQLLVTAESVGANTASFLSSISSTTVTPCACQTQWGFWSAVNGAKDSSGNLIFEDQGILLLWVGGVPTTVGSLPRTGTATYTGHAIADISNAGTINTYLAAGTFSAAVNFGARNGAVTINGLDGTNYAGTAVWVPATTTFATPVGSPLTGNVGGRTAALVGSFFQGGPTNTTRLYGEMGGSLILNGTVTNPYLGSGIFLARKP